MDTETTYTRIVTRLAVGTGHPDIRWDGGVSACVFLAKEVAAKSIAWSTAKQYASAVRWELRRHGGSTAAFDLGWAHLRSLAPRHARRRVPVRRTRITPAVVDAIRTLAEVRDPPSFASAVAFFEAGLMIGLRPCEWAGARWEDEARSRLVVPNAKAAFRVMEHGPFAGRLWLRANGAERVLVLTDAAGPAGLRDVVDRAMAAERSYPWAIRRSSIWRAFKCLVRGACDRGLIAKRHAKLTLYSSRHQFAADMKRSADVGGGEVAAAMGHVAVRTAVAGYGRRSSGRTFAPLIKADAGSVAAVLSRTLPRAPAQRPAHPSPISRPRPPGS